LLCRRYFLQNFGWNSNCSRLCNLFILLNVSRTAVVANIIILIEKPNDGFMASIDRFLSDLVGCTIGLLVVIFTGSMAKFLHKNILKTQNKVNDET